MLNEGIVNTHPLTKYCRYIVIIGNDHDINKGGYKVSGLRDDNEGSLDFTLVTYYTR